MYSYLEVMRGFAAFLRLPLRCVVLVLVVKEINGFVNETMELGSALAFDLYHLHHIMPVVLP